MKEFTINLLGTLGFFDRIYVVVANTINRYVLKRNTLNNELISDAFKIVDEFWLKYGNTRGYSDSQVRVVVGTLIESLRDNNLSADEVKTLVNYVTTKWDSKIAESRTPDSLPVTAEYAALRAVEIFDKLPKNVIDESTFVALGVQAISENLPNSSVLSRILNSKY